MLVGADFAHLTAQLAFECVSLDVIEKFAKFEVVELDGEDFVALDDSLKLK